MNTSEIAEKYGLSQEIIESFITEKNFPHKDSVFSGIKVEDKLVNGLVANVKAYEAEYNQAKLEAKQREIEQKKQAQAEIEKKSIALARMLVTSGFSFDGYKITKYSGYISGDDAVQVPRGTSSIFNTATDTGEALMDSLKVIRRNALRELKEAAYDLGCNAVIGVDFDYITLDPETANLGGGTTYLPYVFGVTANGNAVIIEKDE